MVKEVISKDYSDKDKLLAGNYSRNKIKARKGIVFYASTFLLSSVIGFGAQSLRKEVPKELSDLRVAQEQFDSLAAGRTLENFVSLTNTPEVAEYVANFGESFTSEYDFLRDAHYSLQRKMDDCKLEELESSYSFFDKLSSGGVIFSGLSAGYLLASAKKFRKAKKGLAELHDQYWPPKIPVEDQSGPEFRNGH